MTARPIGRSNGDGAFGSDPRDVIDHAPMSAFQWSIVAIMVALNALDGFDVLSISFAAPGIAAAWGIDRSALGLVLSMELIGMAVGSIVLGGIADRFGRRATILGCLAVMAAGMFGASTAGAVTVLSLWRLLTGFGIGGMLAATNAGVAEVSNLRYRNLAVSLMAAGYPVGAILGGSLAAILLRSHDWPVVFRIGGVATLAMIPLVGWRVPESVAFLARSGTAAALAAINATLRRMGHAPADGIRPPDAAPAAGPAVARLFGPSLRARTILLTLAYLAHIVTFYFILKWTPKIVVDMGFPPASAAGVLVWANIGGASGGLAFGLLATRAPLARLTIAAMLASAVLVTLFGRGQAGLGQMSAIAALAGFCTNAGVVGLYALVARGFDADLRATATGFVIGVGRGGAALGPALAGLLFATGQGLASVAALMALGSLVAAMALFLLSRLTLDDGTGSPVALI